MTLDEYVLEMVPLKIKHFEDIHALSSNCPQSVMLKYEDMILNFDFFIEQLRKYLDIEDAIVDGIYQKSRPRKVEDMKSHRRSGQVQGFRTKLKDTTIEAINIKLADTMPLFGYEI